MPDSAPIGNTINTLLSNTHSSESNDTDDDKQCCSVPFSTPTTVGIFGCTLSGKSTWCKKLLETANEMFTENVNNILYCYGMYQNMFEELQASLPNCQLHEGLPSRDTINSFSDGCCHNLIILDDLQEELGKNECMEKLFTQLAHHLNTSVVFMGNNLFHKNFSRTITLNLHIIVLFKNARDLQQIKCLGRQIFPSQSEKFVSAYKDSTQKPYGYLVIDLSPTACEQLRLRTHIFPGEDPIVYKL